jgi:F0F1-type ATP synthase gamma subunit
MVDEYNGIRSALPENIREQKENAIIALFPNYHTVEDVEVEKKPIIPVETKKRKPAAKEKTQKQVYSHDFDAKALLEKADNVLKDID